ncbi:MAG: sulfotransferase domain-containing protein [Pyrinomonadaceae bacterium]
MQRSPKTAGASNLDRNLISVLQQELDLGTQALKRGNPDVAVTFFQSALRKMTAEMPFYDHAIHNLLLSYKNLVEKLFADGNTDLALKFAGSALELEIRGEMADDAAFLRRFADAVLALGLILFKNGQFTASVASYRKAIAVYDCPTYHVNLTNALAVTGGRARLSDYTTEITPEQVGRHIFIACVPKSASTFLKDLLVNLTGFQDVFMVYAAGQSEHELYLPTIREFAHFNTVTQMHSRASDANVHLMQAFGISPIVLVRNIFDSVMSLLDFYNDQGAFFNSYFRADFQSLDDETKIDLLIDNVIPWYFQFVASWDLAEKQRRLAIKWLSYEDLIADKPAAIEGVLRFYGLGSSAKAIETKIKETESEGRKIRFNKGVAGRGKAGLNEAQKERIRRLSKYYPTTDFDRIGL